jgi:hypothetical protein
MLGRLTARLPEERGERIALGVLVAVLAAGAALRLWLMLSFRPALIGYADSFAYITMAKAEVFSDPMRPAGYSLFLRTLHELNPNLAFTILAQHGLGLASALLLYLAARRLEVPRWWSLLPAAVVALSGPQILIEHAPLTESVFVLLQSGALYCAARAAGERDWAWALGAGVLAGAGVTVRALGILLVVALALCLALLPSTGWRRRLARAAATLAAALVVVGAYVVAQERETGFTGITQAGSWNLYGRAAPFADCDRFDPPAGTRRLCEDKPEDRRPGPNQYIFDPARSPAIRAFGTPFEATQEESDRVAAFARAALVHQPFDWLDHALTEDLPRYVSSDRSMRHGAGLSFDGLQDNLISGFQAGETAAVITMYYSTAGEYRNDRRFDAFLDYERATRVTGVLFVILALVAIAGAFAARRDLQRGALLFGVVTLVSILGPPLTLFYDARYAIPAFGPLAAAAAVGGAALTRLVKLRRGRRSTPPAQAKT